jgi:RNase P subunit RPR2
MPKNNSDKYVLFKCMSCDFEERIPIEAVYFFDIFDPSDVDSPPCVGCEACAGIMIPSRDSK